VSGKGAAGAFSRARGVRIGRAPDGGGPACLRERSVASAGAQAPVKSRRNGSDEQMFGAE